MPTKYLDEEGLSHVVDLAKKKFADKKELWNWQKTEKAGAVAFTPVPDSVLEPVVEFKFKETLPAEGDKGPDNPSTIEGVSEVGVSRCGKNIFQGCRNTNFQRQDNWWYSIELDNTSGDSRQYAMFYVKKTEAYNPDKNYCLVLELDECEPYIFGSSNTSEGQREQLYIKDRTQGVTLSGTGIYKYDLVHSNKTVTDVLIRCTQSVEIGESKSFKFRMAILQCSADEVDLDSYQYENANDSYSIELGDSYYGGSVDFATGQMTVTHVICELDGTENWATLNADGQTPLAYNPTTGYAYSYCYPYSITNYHSKYFSVLSENTSPLNISCTHAINAVNGIGDSGINNGTVDFTGIVLVGNNVRFSFPYSTVTEWKTFLAAQKTAGTPVRFVYRIETPFTVQLTSTQIHSLVSDKHVPQLNIVYTDQKSVQVDYQRFVNEENIVHKSGKETISGEKIFANVTTTQAGNKSSVISIQIPDVIRGELPEDIHFGSFGFIDSTGTTYQDVESRLGAVEYHSPSISNPEQYFQVAIVDYNDRSKASNIKVGIDANGTKYATAPSTSEERTTATDIVTRDWLSKDKRIVQKSDLLNWQKTEKSAVVTCQPVANSSLDAAIDFLFKETLPNNEDPKSPSNSSTIDGVSSITATRCGKNLYNVFATPWQQTRWPDPDSDGFISYSGTYEGTGQLYSGTYHNVSNAIESNKTYTIVLEIASISNISFIFNMREDYAQRGQLNTGYKSISTIGMHFIVCKNNNIYNPNCIARFMTSVNPGNTFSVKFRISIYEGIVNADNFKYEPYSGTEYSISLGDTYYGGSLDTSTGLLTVTHYGRLVTSANAAEAWNGEDDMVHVRLWPSAWAVDEWVPRPDVSAGITCDQLETLVDFTKEAIQYGDYNSTNKTEYIWATFNRSRINISGNPLAALEVRDRVSEYLASHPIKVVYKLYAPYTVQLTPTQMQALPTVDKYEPRLNTLYTDAESIKVGYQKFADEDNLVHRTGNETIEGIKTFVNANPGRTEGDSVTDLTIRNPVVTRGVPGTGANWTRMIFADKDGDTEGNFSGRLGLFELRSPKENDTAGEQITFKCYKYSNTEYWKNTAMELGYDKNQIPFATAPETSNERTNANDIATRGWIESKTWNWQKTKKANIVQFNPIYKSSLEPIVDFSFIETPPAEGTKGQSNPSTIEGISSIKIGHCGKNFYMVSNGESFTLHGVTVTQESDGSLLFNGTCSLPNSLETYQIHHQFEPCLIQTVDRNLVVSIKHLGGSYTLSGEATRPLAVQVTRRKLIDDAVAYCFLGDTGTDSSNYWPPFEYTQSKITTSTLFLINGVSFSNYRIKVQYEFSEEKTPSEFEIPQITEYSISCNNTYYGGSIDTNTGIMTVTWEGIVLTGNEIFSKYVANDTNNVYYTLATSYPAVSTTSCSCTHYPTGGANGCCYVKTTEGKFVFINNSIGSAENFKTWLANEYSNGTPVTIVYNIASPYTVQLSSTLIKALPAIDKYTPRINTVYTDQKSVQVGYPRYSSSRFLSSVIIDNKNPTLFLDGTNDSARDDIHFRVENQQGEQKSLAAIRLVPDGAFQIGRASDPDGAWYNGARIALFKAGGMSLYARNNDGSKSHTLELGIAGTLTWDVKDITGDVHSTGNETISGTKTFTSPIQASITGNSATVNNHSVAKDVPANAAFTDTTYSPATTTTSGLMSSEDKAKLNSIGTLFSFKGSVADSTALPSSNQTTNDAYIALDNSHVHVWNGTSWTDIGAWDGMLEASDSQIDALFED